MQASNAFNYFPHELIVAILELLCLFVTKSPLSGSLRPKMNRRFMLGVVIERARNGPARAADWCLYHDARGCPTRSSLTGSANANRFTFPLFR